MNKPISIVHVSIIIVSICLLSCLMGFSRLPSEETKHYIIVVIPISAGSDAFEKKVTEKISLGWHLQGGVSMIDGQEGNNPKKCFIQALSK